MKISITLLTCLFFTSLANAQTQFIKYKKYLIPTSISCEKPKVIVSTDYGVVPISADANEPQDLVYYFAYSNHFDTRAIIASKSPGIGSKLELESAVSKYSFDYNQHFLTSTNGSDYPTPSYLNGVLYEGVPNQGSNVNPVSSNAATAKIIIEAANATSGCLLNILVWGSMTDVSAAVHNMPLADRDKLRVIAIGSTNKTRDPSAWNYIRDIRNAGGTKFSENIILSDNGSPDAFRSLFLGGVCGVNPTLINDNGSFRGTEDIMDDLTDNVPISNGGLRGLLQSTRGNYSTDELANWQNCQASSATSANSLRLADSLTTLYLLDDVLGFNGELEQIIENNDGTTSGIKNPAVLRKIYDHYRERMNDIY